jgi:integrase
MSGAKPVDRPLSHASTVSLYSEAGERKYVNLSERQRIQDRAGTLKRPQMLFVLTLLWTGARLSEVLALTASSFQLESGCVSISTLKRRRPVVREVPLPAWLIEAIEMQFLISRLQSAPALCGRRLWSFTRWTGWRLVKRVMRLSGIGGVRACPRGLRHSFGVGGAQAGIPVTLLQRWLGHAKLTTTAIYLDAAGPEERDIAARFWRKV